MVGYNARISNYISMDDEIEMKIRKLDILMKNVAKLVSVDLNHFQNRMGRTESNEDVYLVLLNYCDECETLLEIPSVHPNEATMENLLNRLDKCHERMERTLERLSFKINQNRRPSFLVRNWVLFLLTGVSIGWTAKYVYNNFEEISRSVSDSYSHVLKFMHDKVKVPIADALATLRYDPSNKGFAPEDLLVEEELFGRLVADYVEDHFVAIKQAAPPFWERWLYVPDVELSQSEREIISTLQKKALEGNITWVLERYEQDLRYPIRSALRGDLIRSILIQVEKQKLDVLRLSYSMDKMISSNEMTIKLMALLPSLLVGILILNAIFFARKRTESKKTNVVVESLLISDKLLNHLRSNHSQDKSEIIGLIYYYSCKSVDRASYFLDPNKLFEFTEELISLNDSISYEPEHKMHIIRRLFQDIRHWSVS